MGSSAQTPPSILSVTPNYTVTPFYLPWGSGRAESIEQEALGDGR